jgi:hypothetical protein
LTKDKFQKVVQGSNDPGATTRGRHFLLFRVTTGMLWAGLVWFQWIWRQTVPMFGGGVFYDTTRLSEKRSFLLALLAAKALAIVIGVSCSEK